MYGIILTKLILITNQNSLFLLYKPNPERGMSICEDKKPDIEAVKIGIKKKVIIKLFLNNRMSPYLYYSLSNQVLL